MLDKVLNADVILRLEEATEKYVRESIENDREWDSIFAALLRQQHEHKYQVDEVAIKNQLIETYTERLADSDQRLVRCTLPDGELTEGDKAKRSEFKSAGRDFADRKYVKIILKAYGAAATALPTMASSCARCQAVKYCWRV